MKEFLNIATNYIQGKPIYPAIRRFLNLLFNISISSFIYEKYYGTYTWLSIDDYKNILDFFVKGQFFIPFSIFVIVLATTQFLSVTAFIGFNHFKSIKLQREIIKYQYKKEKIDERLADIQTVSKVIIPIVLTPELMIEAYKEIRKEIKPEVFQELENSLKDPRQNLEANFILAFRTFIAITIFKFSIPQFGWTLYVTTAITLLVGMYILSLSYRFLDILPAALRKFHVQAEEYLKEHIENSKTQAKNEPQLQQNPKVEF